eukprot:1147355-Pelagomonas_calceolata.AAC.10
MRVNISSPWMSEGGSIANESTLRPEGVGLWYARQAAKDAEPTSWALPGADTASAPHKVTAMTLALRHAIYSDISNAETTATFMFLPARAADIPGGPPKKASPACKCLVCKEGEHSLQCNIKALPGLDNQRRRPRQQGRGAQFAMQHQGIVWAGQPKKASTSARKGSTV